MAGKVGRFRPWIMWLLGAGFFFCEYFARVNPSVMINSLMHTFGAHYPDVGSLSAYFYYPYILMQLPVGLILDRYGTRRWLGFAALISALGAITFACAPALWVAKGGRILIGFGASFAFVGTMKIASMWFSSSRLGLMAGLTQASGMLGAAFGEGVFVFIVAAIGWRYTLVLIGVILLFFGVMILIFVREKHNPEEQSAITDPPLPLFSGLKKVLTCSQSWWVALYAGLLYAPTAALAELWGVNFFHHIDHLPKSTAAFMMSLVFIGWAIGGPLIGWVSDRSVRIKLPMAFSAIGSFLFLLVVIYWPSLPTSVMMFCLFSYGIFNTGVALAYAVAGRLHEKNVVGVSIAFTNMASIMIGALLQPFLGWLLELQWQHHYHAGLQYFRPLAYQRTLSILPVCLLLTLCCLFMIKPIAKRGSDD